MIHFIFLISAFGLAWLMRLSWIIHGGKLNQGWIRAIIILIIPPLFVLMSAIAILWMGVDGLHNLPRWGGYSCYFIAFSLVVYVLWMSARLLLKNYQLLRQVKRLPIQAIDGYTCRVLETDIFFSSICGIGYSEIVISRGLLNDLSAEQVKAVLAHESAHKFYKDTLTYGVMNLIKDIFPYFPYTKEIMRYLVILREVRADQWATKHTDSLTLLETLLVVSQKPLLHADYLGSSLTDEISKHGIEVRARALLEPSFYHPLQTAWSHWIWLIVACLPLMIVPFHC